MRANRSRVTLPRHWRHRHPPASPLSAHLLAARNCFGRNGLKAHANSIAIPFMPLPTPPPATLPSTSAPYCGKHQFLNQSLLSYSRHSKHLLPIMLHILFFAFSPRPINRTYGNGLVGLTYVTKRNTTQSYTLTAPAASNLAYLLLLPQD